MNILNSIRASIKRRQLRKLDDWLLQLHDQVESGQQAIQYFSNRRRILQGQIDSLDSANRILNLKSRELA